MAVEPRKGLKINSPLILLGGILMVATSLLVFLLIIKGVYGNYEVEEILPTKENLTQVKSIYKKKAAILYSRYTENMLEEGSTWISDNIDIWESYLKSTKIEYELIDDQLIEYGDISEYGILILPGAKSISDREIIKIKKFLEDGGSVFATSGIATFSDEGKWRGWNFFSEVFGLKFTKEIEPDEFESKIHTLRGNLPITAGIPTGYTLKIATWDRPIYAEILDPRTKQVSFWYDFRKELGLVREEIKKSAGIVYGNYGKGRFVWFGFELNSVFGEQEDYIYLDKLFTNCINWLSYLPTAFVKDWPSPYQAAAVFIPTLDKNINNAKNITSYLNSRNYPATFIVDPIMATKNKNLVKTLARYGDLGVRMDVSFMDEVIDTSDKEYLKKLQFSTLEDASRNVEKAGGKKPRALMPYYGYYNEFTLQSMTKNGFDYLISDSLTDRSVPKLEIRNNQPILILTNTVRDDKKIIAEYGLKDLEFQKYTYKEDVDRILFEGGLYLFKIHSSLQMSPQYSPVIKDVINYMKEKNMWVASLSELKKWWLSRGNLEFRYETRSNRRVAVEISNPDESRSDDFTVQLNMNKKIHDIEISSDIINTPIPEYYFDEKTFIIYLYIKNLKAGESRSYFIDFKNVNEK